MVVVWNLLKKEQDGVSLNLSFNGKSVQFWNNNCWMVPLFGSFWDLNLLSVIRKRGNTCEASIP